MRSQTFVCAGGRAAGLLTRKRVVGTDLSGLHLELSLTSDPDLPEDRLRRRAAGLGVTQRGLGQGADRDTRQGQEDTYVL